MKSSIDRGFYCSADLYDNYLDKCLTRTYKGYGVCGFAECLKTCKNYRRKWPTPEQFKEEYGENVPGNMPVWYIDSDDEPLDVWELSDYGNAIDDERYKIVIACTPWGKPPDDWRPE